MIHVYFRIDGKASRFKMTPFVKGTVSVFIGAGIFFAFCVYQETEEGWRRLGLVRTAKTDGGDARRVVSKTGAYQNAHFNHMFDYKLAESMVTIMKQNNIASITDMGCGTGHYVKFFEESQIKSQGFDGNPDTQKYDVSEGLCVGPVDITEKKFWEVTDAAMSLEVAEHIPAEYEQAFISNLVNSARHLIFLSWGVPGQPGDFHVNGQLEADVIQKMMERGWEKNEALTQKIKNDAEFEHLRRNTQVFNRIKNE